MYPDAPFLQFIMRQTWSVQSAHFSCPVEGAIKEFWGFKVMFVKIMCRNTMSDVPLLNTTVMSHNDGQRIALLTKLFCMSKVATFSGRF